jgi:hypothetical protein
VGGEIKHEDTIAGILFGLMLWTECKIVQFPISPNTHTNESQTAQTCLDQYSSQNGFCICGLKIFEKVAAQIEKYPVQIKMGGYTMEFRL